MFPRMQYATHIHVLLVGAFVFACRAVVALGVRAHKMELSREWGSKSTLSRVSTPLPLLPLTSYTLTKIRS